MWDGMGLGASCRAPAIREGLGAVLSAPAIEEGLGAVFSAPAVGLWGEGRVKRPKGRNITQKDVKKVEKKR